MDETAAVVRDSDPRRTQLERDGFVVVGESWGARLRLGEPPDLGHALAAVERATAAGTVVAELDAGWAPHLVALEAANHADYPATPATAQPIRDEAACLALWADGYRVFGAVDDGRVVAASVIRRPTAEPYAETEFTSVVASHRRRGLGVAVKAASILALAADGVRTFGTGGAQVNAGSLAMNRALGYVIDERWLSYARPADSGRSSG